MILWRVRRATFHGRLRLCVCIWSPIHLPSVTNLLYRRLDYALTEIKRKYDMPVKGWRPILAIHNAKSERFREKHKEHMEQVRLDHAGVS